MKSESWFSALLRKEIALMIFALLLVFLWGVLSCAAVYKPDAVAELSWLRSAVFDHDLHFGNEYKTIRQSMFHSYATATGYRVNPLGVGVAVLLLPFYLLGFIGTWVHNLNSVNPLAYDGLNIMFRLAAGLGGAFYGAATIFLSARIAACFASRRTAAWSALLVAAGTPLLYYSSIGALYPHSATAFLVALFIDRLLAEHENAVSSAFLTGLVTGLMLAASLQCIFILLLLPLAWWQNHKWKINTWAVFAVGLLIGFLPQFIAWQIIYGSPLPLGQLFIWQGQPGFSPLQVLFSSHHGLFVWSPLLAFTFIGFGLLYKRQRLYAFLLVAVCLALIVVNSVFSLYDDLSFGARHLTACTPLFAVGLALFLRKIETIPSQLPKVVSAFLIFICTAWSILLLGVFAAHMPDNEYISFTDIGQRLLLYIGGDSGELGAITGESLPSSNGGRAMLLVFALAAFVFSWLPTILKRALPVFLLSASACFFCAVALLPQNIDDKLLPLQHAEWSKWNEYSNRPDGDTAEMKERSLCANKLLLIVEAGELRCRVAEQTRDSQDALDCAILHLMMHQPDRAEKTIRRYGLEKQRNDSVFFHLGVIEMMRFNPAKAVTWFKTSNSIKPNAAAQMMLANAYYELNRYDLAAETYRAILAANPENKAAASGLERLHLE